MASTRSPKFPADLEPPEVSIWQSITTTYGIDGEDAAGLTILETAMRAHARARRYRE